MSPDGSDDTAATSAGRGVKSVETTFTVVEQLAALGGAGVTELAEATGLSKGAVHKHLTTLREQGYVVKRGDVYGLGLRFLALGNDVRVGRGFDEGIQSKVNQLADATGQAAAFIVEEDGQAVVCYRCPARERLASRSQVGTRFMMHRTASGKALLAECSDDRVAAIIDRHGLERATDATLATREDLFEELHETRERGYAVNFGESTPGLSALAVPLTDDARTVGALSVAGPEHRFADGEFREDVLEALRSIRNEVELEFTYG